LRRQVQDWALDDNSKCIFWLNGKAGTGKSTIARTVAQSFSDNDQLGASFFFKKGEADRGNATKFFTTIATQLCRRLPRLHAGIKKAIDDDPDIAERYLGEQFNKLIYQPLSNLNRDFQQSAIQTMRLVIVLDALDECEPDEDMKEILQLLQSLKDLAPISFRILVTGRPDFSVRLGFDNISETYQELVLHAIAEETIRHDLYTFLKYRFTAIRKERSRLPPEWPGDATIHTLVDMAVPLFIFAATVCRFVGGSGNPQKHLEMVLNYDRSGLSQLDQTYLPILSPLCEDGRAGDALDFQRTVGTIVVLVRPLSITALAHLLDEERWDIMCTLDSLHSVVDVPTDETMPIRIFHLSFRDFLFDSKRRTEPFWVDEKETHHQLASRCIKLLSKALERDILKQYNCDFLKTEIDGHTVGKHLPDEIKYACCYWAHHVVKSESGIYDNDQVHCFLQTYFVYWLEALSLIQEVSQGIRVIDSLLKLVKVSLLHIHTVLLYTDTSAYRHLVKREQDKSVPS
jgi:hypothetical protein